MDPIFETLRPRKSVLYCRERYPNHPSYKCDIHAIMDGDSAHGLIVSRRAEANRAAALRIGDFLGAPHALSGLRGELQRLLETSGAEYADLMCAGMDEGVMSSAGLLLRDQGAASSGVIVPMYFEPFERRNIDLDFAFRITDGGPVSFFKGDGD